MVLEMVITIAACSTSIGDVEQQQEYYITQEVVKGITYAALAHQQGVSGTTIRKIFFNTINKLDNPKKKETGLVDWIRDDKKYWLKQLANYCS
jgi:uncharacterized alkaline shock family protein YloU